MFKLNRAYYGTVDTCIHYWYI